jgi:DNA-binding response OmpR family regulator
MTILVVDDDTGIREMLTIFLTFNGYAAVAVANGAEALAYLQQQPVLPHLILLDLTMPIMDGIVFHQAQQQDARLMHIPVVVMSAVEEVLAAQVSAEAYLPKPIDFDALLALVEQHSSQSHQRGV